MYSEKDQQKRLTYVFLKMEHSTWKGDIQKSTATCSLMLNYTVDIIVFISKFMPVFLCS